jgi:hypothetical protein
MARGGGERAHLKLHAAVRHPSPWQRHGRHLDPPKKHHGGGSGGAQRCTRSMVAAWPKRARRIGKEKGQEHGQGRRRRQRKNRPRSGRRRPELEVMTGSRGSWNLEVKRTKQRGIESQRGLCGQVPSFSPQGLYLGTTCFLHLAHPKLDTWRASVQFVRGSWLSWIAQQSL